MTADDTGSRVRGAGVRVAGVSAALVVALAGCSGTPHPASSTPGGDGTVVTSSPTTVSVPSPTTTPPARPTAMDRADSQGAIAAATYFISLYSYAYATGDLVEWKAMSDPACIFCGSVVGNVEKMQSLGHTSQGPSISIDSAQSAPPAAGTGILTVELQVEQGPSVERDAAGVVVDRVDESKSLSLVVALAHDRAAWIVHEISTDVVRAHA